ncbi:MAG: 23S rRNA (pseudouridine(1915)-N(3))-methyltransferase RlmH [Deltaproteobacteria bacterium]|nr:23S rRNA (pseudouridine(1915)-N(3))-methyltransferase RlmH [Deltaproteobacteria bacterium]
MKIRVVAPGKPSHAGAVAWTDDFGARIDRLMGYERTVVREGKRARGGRGSRAKSAESTALLEAIPPGAVVVAMDAAGKRYDSEQFLEWMVGVIETSPREIAFLIGGPDGLDREVRSRADHLVSVSPMTLPHELAEVVLLEAVYRALMRWKGLPYHR